MQRVTPTESYNPEPEARYYRSMAEAFPCGPEEAVSLFAPERRVVPLFACSALLLLLCWVLLT
nr:hypothetical protein [Delftia sp. PE138]